jgi:phage tail-like protein
MTDRKPGPGLALRFNVSIDKWGSLGDWTKCEGLSVEYDMHEYKEGGQNAFTHRLPGRAKYQNIKLTRPINKSSADVAAWVSSAQVKTQRSHGSVTLMDEGGAPVARWSLTDLFPARWSGPSFDVAGNQTATEVLELAHSGFKAE